MTVIVNDVKYYFLFLHKGYSSASSVRGSSTKVSNEASCVLTMTARRIHLGHFTQLGPALGICTAALISVTCVVLITLLPISQSSTCICILHVYHFQVARLSCCLVYFVELSSLHMSLVFLVCFIMFIVTDLLLFWDFSLLPLAWIVCLHWVSLSVWPLPVFLV